MCPVEIRNLTVADYDAVIRLWERAGLPFKPKGRDSEHQIKQQMTAFPDFFIGSFHNGDLVGVVVGSYDGRMKGWINRLAVDPRYRRKGVGRALITAVEEALEKHGATIFCALIETLNEESLSLFRKSRYVVHQDVLYVTKRKREDV
ncbi:MAG: GNAT family N-acetyltransferase [Candidatus Bathyarchaeota archaeon]|nr:MAG: GNAT family N-acetyltransferase [Candidatus Bathyarchaeota archaeon]